jgi:demethylmenaquinone methyltransferase/2-methoxy-6-polyprenyl-1,4-benzoquinol methylase
MKPVGGLVSKDKKAYDYLPDSIVEFPDRERFLEIMSRTGFVECRRRSQSLGIAQIYIGKKP